MYLNNGNYISGGALQSRDFAQNGKHSLRLDAEDPYGFNYSVPFKGNEDITVSVWRFANNMNTEPGILVASGPCGFWKAGKEIVETLDNGWEKIQFTFSPPKKCKGKELSIYCWNSSQHPIYFDDLDIEIKHLYF